MNMRIYGYTYIYVLVEDFCRLRIRVWVNVGHGTPGHPLLSTPCSAEDSRPYCPRPKAASETSWAVKVFGTSLQAAKTDPCWNGLPVEMQNSSS